MKIAMKIGILVPTLTNGDAVSHDAIGMARCLRGRGYDVEFFTLRNTSDEATRPVHDLASNLRSVDDVLIYHHQISFEAGVRAVESLACRRKVVKYHNVTPPEFFADFDDTLAKACEEGIRQVERLARSDAHIWADSHFNLEQLWKLHPGRAAEELPPFHQADELQALEPDSRAVSGFDDWVTNILMVGRVAPNKNVPLAVSALAEYRQRFSPHARLLVAGDASVPTARAEVEQATRELGQEGHVYLLGKVSQQQLKALYLTADVLIVTSLHEGFCVPLVEAMALRVPILAMPTTAVPGTAGAAALYANDAIGLANLIDELLSDASLREQQVALGRDRYTERFSHSAIEARFLALFNGL